MRVAWDGEGSERSAAGPDQGTERSAAGPVTGEGGALRAGSSSTPPPPVPPAREAALYSTSERVGDDFLLTARFKEW